MTYTDRLRERTLAACGVCPMCGGPGRSLRVLAKEIGTNASSLHRFLKGKTINSDFVDKLERWLTKESP